MSIRYLRSNLSKLPTDNIINFLYNLTMYDVQDIDEYVFGKVYKNGERIYLQENGEHQIFQCKVEESSKEFKNEEWEHILEVYNGSISKVSNLIIKDEVHMINENNTESITTNLDFIPQNSSFALYCGLQRFALGYDFTVSGNVITFNKPFNVGDRVILEVRELTGVVNEGIVLRSSNGHDYEVFEYNDDLYIIESDKVSRANMYIKDIVSGKNYRIFMVDEDILYEYTDSNTTQTEIIIPNNGSECIIRMIDGELYYEIIVVSSIVLKDIDGTNYILKISDNELFVAETDIREGDDQIFIKDTDTGVIYKLYVNDKNIYFDHAAENINDAETKISVFNSDEDGINYYLEMRNSVLFIINQ